MGLRAVLLAAAVVAWGLTGCRQQPRLPEGVTVESQLPPGVSWASLLLEASRLESLLAVPPESARSRQFSSSADSDKVSLAHLAPEVLGDLDHGFFLRVEDKDGEVEATLAEAEGAGAITWIWSANPAGRVLLYLDGRPEPVAESDFEAFLGGAFLPVREPFAALTANGHNLHFPIVHTNGFRLAVRAKEKKELASLFYHVAWNALDPAVPAISFDPEAIRASAPLLGSLADRFRRPPSLKEGGVAFDGDLKKGARLELIDPAEAGIVLELEIEAGRREALSQLALEARWDGSEAPAVDCPLAFLAGASGYGENVDSIPAVIRGSKVVLRWPMPYGKGSRLALVNRGDRTWRVRGSQVVRSDGETLPALRFHAERRSHERLDLLKRQVMTLAEPRGAGWIAGCHLRVKSRSAGWWGEGDERIWLDGQEHPAWQGTGTEDYFGFAWCSETTFGHPLRGQSLAERLESGGRSAAMRRYHLLDRMPFHRFARFDFEALGLTEGRMDCETLVLWYGAP